MQKRDCYSCSDYVTEQMNLHSNKLSERYLIQAHQNKERCYYDTIGIRPYKGGEFTIIP